MNPGIVAYLVSAMTAWVPVQAHSDAATSTMARYDSIAQDAATVAEDPSEDAIFPGPAGRTQTALLLLSVASFESGYRTDVDGGTRRGDGGRSYCLAQIRVGEGATSDGWTGPQLVADRTLCFRAALHILRGSFNVCRGLPLVDRMSAYATGHCFEGAQVSRTRVGRALGWWDAHPLPLDSLVAR